MAAPTPTARGSIPSGTWKMPEGFQVLVTFATKPAIQLYEKEIQPPGVDAGDAINTTTQQNAAWMTKAFGRLKELTSGTCQFGYDPDVYTDIIALVGVNTTVTVTLPDGSTIAFYGGLQRWTPTALRIREFAIAEGIIVPTNWDPTNNVEAGPVYTAFSSV